MNIRCILVLFAVLMVAATPARAQETVVDLELALAVDASASVDDAEFRLQLDGIAYAFRDPEIHAAIESGQLGRIAVTMVVWAEAKIPKDFAGWFIVDGATTAEQFADLVQTYPRRLTGGTGLGEGIAKTIADMDKNGITAERLVIDVSGDGEETAPRDFIVMATQARAMARARGITINGLAVLNEVPDLDDWYRRHVQTGARSFVMSVQRYEDFALAMRRKLLREIEPLPELSMRFHDACRSMPVAICGTLASN